MHVIEPPSLVTFKCRVRLYSINQYTTLSALNMYYNPACDPVSYPSNIPVLSTMHTVVEEKCGDRAVQLVQSQGMLFTTKHVIYQVKVHLT